MSDKKKPRDISLVMDFVEPQRIDQVGFDNGEIQMVCDGSFVTPQRANIVSSYERATKPKIINEVSLLTGWERLTLNPDLALREYDYVCAIDTNTRTIRGDSVSVTTTAICRFMPVGPDRTLGLCGQGELALGYKNVEDKPENIGWRDFIAAWQRNPKSAGRRTACIVDSDYGNLSAFNARIRPIVIGGLLSRQYETLGETGIGTGRRRATPPATFRGA